jgi:two-component system, OmpR family, sensor histidine kinase VicK
VKVYLFSRTDNQMRSAFRADYCLQNLKAIKNISFAYIIVIVAINLLAYFFKFNIDDILHISDFTISLFFSFCVVSAFYLLSRILISKFSTRYSFILLSQIIVIAFSMFMISRGMLNTFHASHNPRNALTMYMIWLILVSVFFVFEYYETLIIIAFCLIVFSILLPQYQPSSTEIYKNEFVSFIMLAVFFFSSRHFFSYRVNHFMQLKTIQEKNLQIENANHIKDEILGVVAHDLRNPLGAIESIAMLMEMDVDENDESAMENIMMIKGSCEKARSIINDLIEVARNDNEDGFGLQQIDLNTFLSNVINEWLQNKTGAAKIVFNGTKQPTLSWINKEKMQRVMDNLISNALKFSEAGTQIEVLLKQIDGKCYIKVKDAGLGIPEELLPHVFDRFSKASRKGLRGENSVGLGLSIVRQIIKKHGGDIVVDSTEGKGTTFTISLPQSITSLPAA